MLFFTLTSCSLYLRTWSHRAEYDTLSNFTLHQPLLPDREGGEERNRDMREGGMDEEESKQRGKWIAEKEGGRFHSKPSNTALSNEKFSNGDQTL